MPNPRLTQFATDLHQEVLQRSGDNAALQLREEAFTEYVLELLSEHNETDAAEVCYHEARSVGQVPAAKLNAYALSGDGATLDLFVSLYRGTGAPDKVGLPETRRQFRLLRGFLRRVLDGFHTRMEEAGDAFRPAQQIYGQHGQRLLERNVRAFKCTPDSTTRPDRRPGPRRVTQA